MALNRSDKSRILRRYFPGMTRNSEMSTEPSHCAPTASLPPDSHRRPDIISALAWPHSPAGARLTSIQKSQSES